MVPFHKYCGIYSNQGSACDLLTGEEAQFASEDENSPAPRLSCTVEMANLGNTCKH